MASVRIGVVRRSPVSDGTTKSWVTLPIRPLLASRTATLAW